MAEDTARSTIVSDMGPWSVVPEWLLDSDVSDRAKVLYALLGRYADSEGRSWPSRRKLAERLSCSTDTLDRAIRELVGIEALSVVQRRDEAGDRTSNLYTLRYARVRRGGRTDAATGGGTGAETGGGTGAAGTRTRDEREPDGTINTQGSDLAVARALGPRTVDRKPVTDNELTMAWAVLTSWNRAAGQALRSHDWLAKIIMRCREYPEATLADHTLIIETALAHPWWKGPASPSVVYGSGAQFERSIQAVRATKGETEDERFRRIVQAGIDRGRRTA